MEFPIKISLDGKIYNQDSLELTKINLFFGINGTGKSITLKQISKQIPGSMLIDENRSFHPDIIAISLGDENSIHSNLLPSNHNLAQSKVISEINESLTQLFPDRKLDNGFTIGSMQKPITIKKLGKNYSVGSDGRGIWNVVKPLEALILCDSSFGVLIEEFSLGLYPGKINQYYELVKEKILRKKSFLVTTTQDPFVVYQFIKNKINQDLSWEDNEPEVSLFKFSENENGKIDIMKIDEDSQSISVNELMNDYAEGIDMIKFSQIFSKPDERLTN